MIAVFKKMALYSIIYYTFKFRYFRPVLQVVEWQSNRKQQVVFEHQLHSRHNANQSLYKYLDGAIYQRHVPQAKLDRLHRHLCKCLMAWV